MNINTRAKALIGAVAIGGAAIAMGGAFTAGGIDLNGNTSTYVGGTDEVAVTGATLNSLAKVVDDGANEITSVTMEFDSAAAGKDVSIEFADDVGAVDGVYDCNETTVDPGPVTFLCDGTADPASTGVSTLAITVSTADAGA